MEGPTVTRVCWKLGIGVAMVALGVAARQARGASTALPPNVTQAMVQQGAKSWTSPDPALRCGIATVTIEPYKMPDLELWMWKQKKIRIRGGSPSKVRLSTPYYLRKRDIDCFLAAADEYRNAHPA